MHKRQAGLRSIAHTQLDSSDEAESLLNDLCSVGKAAWDARCVTEVVVDQIEWEKCWLQA